MQIRSAVLSSSLIFVSGAFRFGSMRNRADTFFYQLGARTLEFSVVRFFRFTFQGHFSSLLALITRFVRFLFYLHARNPLYHSFFFRFAVYRLCLSTMEQVCLFSFDFPALSNALRGCRCTFYPPNQLAINFTPFPPFYFAEQSSLLRGQKSWLSLDIKFRICMKFTTPLPCYIFFSISFEPRPTRI